MAVLCRHLGWMRDLRGQKKAAKPDAAAASDIPGPTGDSGNDKGESSGSNNSAGSSSSGSGGCFDIDENIAAAVPPVDDCGGEDIVQGEEGSEHGHDEKKSSSGVISGAGSGAVSSSSGAGAESTTGDGESKGDGSGIDTSSDGDSSQSKPLPGSESRPGSASESASEPAVNVNETPRRRCTLPSMDEGSDDGDEDQDEEVSEEGVRLALLPDIRR